MVDMPVIPGALSLMPHPSDLWNVIRRIVEIKILNIFAYYVIAHELSKIASTIDGGAGTIELTSH